MALQTVDIGTGEIIPGRVLDLDLLTQPFKPESIRYRDGGYDRATGTQRQLAYLDGATVVRRLNAACPEWTFEVTRESTAERPENVTLLIARGRLTIPGLGAREAVGVQEVKPNSGIDFYKGHYTDALKKCASLFGVGLELYGTDYESDDAPAPPPRPTAADNARAAFPPNGAARLDSKPAPAPRNTPSPTPNGTRYPDQARVDGVKDMAGVNALLRANGFTGGNKGEVIRELEGTYGTTILSPSGKLDDYGKPALFPSDIYNFAHYHITQTALDNSTGATTAVRAAAGRTPVEDEPAEDDDVPF